MRTLIIHASEFSYNIKQRVKIPIVEDVDEGQTYEFRNCLVIFVTVEKDDITRLREIKGRFGEDIAVVMGQVNAESAVIYPYAHLSSNLSDPRNAIRVLKRLEDELKARGVSVHRSPFGWYKEFKLHCLGHPLSELSRSF